jgi:peroxiredoxin
MFRSQSVVLNISLFMIVLYIFPLTECMSNFDQSPDCQTESKAFEKYMKLQINDN